MFLFLLVLFDERQSSLHWQKLISASSRLRHDFLAFALVQSRCLTLDMIANEIDSTTGALFATDNSVETIGDLSLVRRETNQTITCLCTHKEVSFLRSRTVTILSNLIPYSCLDMLLLTASQPVNEELSEWAREVTCFICGHFDAAGRARRIGIGGIEIGLKDNFIFRNRA